MGPVVALPSIALKWGTRSPEKAAQGGRWRGEAMVDDGASARCHGGSRLLARNVLAIQPVGRDGRQSIGRLGEDLACAELARRGYVIVDRRYRTRYGEIDIVARDGEVLVFVEVKARGGDAFGGAVDAVISWKQRRVARMAADYLARKHPETPPCRFDVVAVDLSQGDPRVDVYAGAFDA
jgi:putative endonuclease